MPRSHDFDDDPAPFECVDGDEGVGVLVVCDHASAALPARLGDLGLDGATRRSHVAWDIGAAEVARGLAARLGCPAVLAGISRLVVDCNRAPGESGWMPAVTCGVRVPGNVGLAAAEAEWRAAAWYRPYHAELAAALDRQRRRGVVPAVVSVHSFTPSLAGAARPWHVGVLWNRDPRLARPLIAGLSACSSLVVGDNQPYSAREINHTLDSHAGAAGLPHVSVEIRQDLLADSAGTSHWALALAELLAPLLADPRLHRVETY